MTPQVSFENTTMVNGHGRGVTMETISVSEFEATCLAVIERVQKTGQPVLVTKRGVPVAQLVPPSSLSTSETSPFGCMKELFLEVSDDLITSIADSDWEALR